MHMKIIIGTKSLNGILFFGFLRLSFFLLESHQFLPSYSRAFAQSQSHA